MKKIFVTLLAIATFGAAAFAQEKREMKHEGKMHHKGGHGGKKMMAHMDLSDAQQNQMKTINEEFRTKMQALEQNKSMNVGDYKAQKAALLKEKHDKMQAILTPEQKKQMEEKKEMMESSRTARHEKKLAEMKTKLSLSDDQVSKLKSQHEAMKSKIKAIRENQSLSPEDKKQQIKAAKEAAKTEHKSILTAEQLKKFEEIRKEHKKGKKSKDWKDAK
jgi:Spy/CpxP family protein refolding chaperone